jgi:hypothetical protein
VRCVGHSVRHCCHPVCPCKGHTLVRGNSGRTREREKTSESPQQGVVVASKRELVLPIPAAPTVSAWAQECIAWAGTASAKDLASLIQEVSDAASDEPDEQSAKTWADGFHFSKETVANDMTCSNQGEPAPQNAVPGTPELGPSGSVAE